MIKHPLLIVCILLSIELLVLWVSNQSRFKRYFKFLPALFWIYFLPMVVSTIGLIDPKSPIYQMITAHFLPASLFLLLITVDVKAILRLGPTALIMFFAGSLGVIIGASLVFWIFKDWVGVEFWSGFGALAGSWTGGSANMIAVKEALGTPDAVFLPMVIVDTVVPYVWMGFLVAMSSAQPLYDRWNGSDRRILDELKERMEKFHSKKVQWHFGMVVMIAGLGLVGSFCAQFIAKFFPVIKEVVSPYAWTIIIVSSLAIILSFTKAKKLEHFGSTKIGYCLLYFVLTSIGAKASLKDFNSTLVLILAGFMIALIHAGVLVAASRWLKAPMFLVAAASQANLGGVASAPIVAELYQRGFASVGLLMAILGNIIGTYLGILSGQIARWIAGL